ncbi:hypothetical protein [Lentibacillus populi]|nr:hypothetical protein [Lentibacillus populi]
MLHQEGDGVGLTVMIDQERNP